MLIKWVNGPFDRSSLRRVDRSGCHAEIVCRGRRRCFQDGLDFVGPGASPAALYPRNRTPGDGRYPQDMGTAPAHELQMIFQA